jgi:hypothetical protein
MFSGELKYSPERIEGDLLALLSKKLTCLKDFSVAIGIFDSTKSSLRLIVGVGPIVRTKHWFIVKIQ